MTMLIYTLYLLASFDDEHSAAMRLLLEHGAPADRPPGEARTEPACLICLLPPSVHAAQPGVHMFLVASSALFGVLALPVPTNCDPACSTGLTLPGHPGSLILPAKHGHTAAVEALLEHGAELAPAGRADNAIMWAAKHPGTCMALLAASRSLPQVGQLLLPRPCCPAHPAGRSLSAFAKPASSAD